MISPDSPDNEMALAASAAAFPADIDTAAQLPTVASFAEVAAAAESSPPVNVPVTRKAPTSKKAPVREIKATARKKLAAKYVSPHKANPATPVVVKSREKTKAATEKTSPKDVGRTPTPKKAASVKKALAKKPSATDSKSVKVAATKDLVPSPSVNPSTAVTPKNPKASPVESTRDAGKAKAKLVRDSFTMPQQDFGLIALLKERALGFKRSTKKSELLRAGLHVLQQLSDSNLRNALDSLVPLKAGRPKKKVD